MSTVHFVFVGTLKPKERARVVAGPDSFELKDGKVARVRGKARAYTPKDTKDLQDAVAMTAKLARQKARMDLMDGPVTVTVRLFVPTPKNWPLERREAATAPAPSEWPTNLRGDVDNVLKLLLDAMQGIVFKNDRQVVQIFATKLYGHDERAEVTVWELEGVQDGTPTAAGLSLPA